MNRKAPHSYWCRSCSPPPLPRSPRSNSRVAIWPTARHAGGASPCGRFCSAERLTKAIEQTAWMVLDFKEQSYQRCDVRGCDRRALEVSRSGIFTVATAGDGTFLKALNDGGDFVDVATLGTSLFANFGRCRVELQQRSDGRGGPHGGGGCASTAAPQTAGARMSRKLPRRPLRIPPARTSPAEKKAAARWRSAQDRATYSKGFGCLCCDGVGFSMCRSCEPDWEAFSTRGIDRCKRHGKEW